MPLYLTRDGYQTGEECREKYQKIKESPASILCLFDTASLPANFAFNYTGLSSQINQSRRPTALLH